MIYKYICKKNKKIKKNKKYIYIYTYLITSILRNIASQLQCISASATGTSAIPVTDEQHFSVAM